MATRACIEIEGLSFAYVYKHWDGYPEAMLDWLTEFNKNFNKNRGFDTEYKLAQLLRSSVRDAKKYKYDLDESLYTGWGIVPHLEMSQDYTYTLHSDGSVSIKEHL